MATIIDAPLPDLTWRDQSILEVDTGDASVLITKLTIHLAQDIPDEVLKLEPVAPLFSYGASA